MIPARRITSFTMKQDRNEQCVLMSLMISASKRTIGNFYAYTYLDVLLKAEE
ncbi:MAG: hypothetical protein RXR51_04820 [Nitrososphaeria archaeon]